MRLLIIFGPPSVGKMTVGRSLAAQSGFRLFHNHAVLEPLLEVFDYGTPPFIRLLEEFRRRVVEEAAASGADLIWTYVWGLDLEEDARWMRKFVGPYMERGAEVAFVELYADLDTRLERNRTEHRLSVKPSKRDLDWSDGVVRELESHMMNTERGDSVGRTPGERLLEQHRHLRIDNSAMTAGETAGRILRWLDHG